MAVTLVNSGFRFRRSSGGGRKKAPHNFSYVVFPRHSMQPVRMECVISSLLGGLGDQDLLGMTDKNQVGLWMSSATFNSSQKLYSRLPYLNNALNDKTLLRKLGHGAASSIPALSLRFVFSVALIEATIQCAGWVLHQLAVCAARGEAFKRMVSTQGCGWIREMGSAESCCVVWPLNGLRVDCGGQLADGVAVQSLGRGMGLGSFHGLPDDPSCKNNAGQCWSATFYLLCPYSYTFHVRNLYLLLILDYFFCCCIIYLWEGKLVFVLDVMFHQTLIPF